MVCTSSWFVKNIAENRCHILSDLIRVHTICSCLSVQILRKTSNSAYREKRCLPSWISVLLQLRLGFLWRNLAFAPCSRQTKDAAYKTLVRPKLEYAAPIWHPHVKTQITQLEKVQRTAARWACRRWQNTSSVGDRLQDLDWPPLLARREKSSLAFFHKINMGTVSTDKDTYLTPHRYYDKLGHPIIHSIILIHTCRYPRIHGCLDELFFPPGLFHRGIAYPLLW